MKLSQQQQLFTYQVSKLIQYIFSVGYSCTFGEALRSPEQAQIYAKEGKGIANSLHCKKLAIDLNLFSPDGVYLELTEDYEKFGVYWESLDKQNRWGGRFLDSKGKPKPDGNHMERMEQL